MPNPIIAALSRMNNISGIINSLNSGDPEKIFRQMYSSNPQFRQFVDENKNKSAEQIAQENGIDLNDIKNYFR